jgi:hypothetical protein
MIIIKILKLSFILLFIAFIVAYSIGESGYYEYKLSNKKNLTDEQIEKFEQDIKDGKDIDIADYLSDDKIDYTNSLSRTTYKFSDKLNKVLKNGIETIFKFANKLVED